VRVLRDSLFGDDSRAASMPSLSSFAKGVPRSRRPERASVANGQRPLRRVVTKSCSATPTEIDAADHSLGCETLDNEGKRAQRVVLYVYRSQYPAGIAGSTRPRRGASSRSACVIGPVSAQDIGNRIAEEADGSFMTQLVAVILATALSRVRPTCSENLRPFCSGTPASIACAGLMSRTNMAMVQRLM
jgi:hypothetical protein